MNNPSYDGLTDSDLLSLYIGKIVVGCHRLSECFTIPGPGYDSKAAGEKFDKRKTTWFKEVKKLIKRDADALTKLSKLESKVTEVQQIRDALVHGGPYVQRRDPDVRLVICMLTPSRRKYIQRSLDHTRRTAPAHIRRSQLLTKRNMMATGKFPIEVSYPLATIEKMAQTVPDLQTEVMQFWGIANREQMRAYGLDYELGEITIG